MNDLTRFLAQEKMLEEMSKKHSAGEEAIHNWLSDQVEDEDLYNAILKDGKTISGSFAYCTQKAKEEAGNNQCAMVEDATVFSWVREYFMRDDIKNVTPVAKVSTSTKKSKSTKKTTKEGVEETQMSLFDI